MFFKIVMLRIQLFKTDRTNRRHLELLIEFKTLKVVSSVTSEIDLNALTKVLHAKSS